MIMTNSMKVYYIAFNYGHGGLEMIDGPFPTLGYAHNERMKLLGNETKDDSKLVIVADFMEVVIV